MRSALRSYIRRVPTKIPFTAQRIQHCSSNPLRFTAATVDAVDTEPIVTEKKVVDALFPWRDGETSLIFSLPEYFTHFLSRALITELHLNQESQMKPGEGYMDIDFLFGSKQAFESAMIAIFNSKKIRAGEVLLHKIEDENEGNKETKENKESVDNKDEITEKIENKTEDTETVKESNNDTPFVPDLTELFDTKLAHFYENAIDLSYKLNHKVFHKVEEVGTPMVIKYDIVYGAERGADMTGLVKKKVFGVLQYMAPLEKSAAAFGEGELHRPFNPRNVGCVRITLLMPTKEVFYVENTSTDLVIQGSKELVENNHKVIFETMIGPSHKEFEWKITDIDDWLEGNEFWITRKRDKKI